MTTSASIVLTPEQVETRLARIGLTCQFAAEDRGRFTTTPVVALPSERTFAFPIPTGSDLTLRQIRASAGTDPQHPPSVFDHDWYAHEDFMDRVCPPGWHILTMDVLADTTGQDLNYIRSRTPLPMAVEVVLMLFLHYIDTGEQLLLRKHTWCSDRASLGRRVTVGAFGRNGVFLSGHPENFASRGLGACANLCP
jgi:hypothetical protein